MGARYQQIQFAAHQIGDEHYRTMNEWLVSGAQIDSENRCREKAIAYRRDLDNLLATLDELPQTVEVERAIQSTLEFRALIASDLKLIGSRTLHHKKRSL